MESCKGCGGKRTDTYKGKVYCHFCGEELGDDTSGRTIIFGSSGSSRPAVFSYGSFISTSMEGIIHADRT